jgi:hypothetical protein
LWREKLTEPAPGLLCCRTRAFWRRQWALPAEDGLEVVEKLLMSFMVESSERHPGLTGVKCLQRQLPWEQSDALATGAWLVEFQHLRTGQELHAGGSKPVDAGLEGRMLGLGGVDERQGHHREALAMASVNSPRARVSLIPAAHLLIVLKVAGATTMASGGGSTSAASGCLYSERTG